MHLYNYLSIRFIDPTMNKNIWLRPRWLYLFLLAVFSETIQQARVRGKGPFTVNSVCQLSVMSQASIWVILLWFHYSIDIYGKVSLNSYSRWRRPITTRMVNQEDKEILTCQIRIISGDLPIYPYTLSWGSGLAQEFKS